LLINSQRLYQMKNLKYLCLGLIIQLLVVMNLNADDHHDIVVDALGKGDYKTITEAIDALPMYPYQRMVIYIKNGIYKEKIRIEQNYITLKGESRDSTIIRYSQLRKDWNDNKDYIGPAVINLEGDDIVLDNLTIENSQPEIGPHAFAVYGKTNRTIIINSNVISKGGDTVSLWNYKYGMYYHANCYFEGAGDFVCPRGWCFIRDSKFYELKKTAAIWHAGNYLPEQKFVIRNSYFDGVIGFQLGRHHYEAAFYFLDCNFSETMADKPIYKVMSKNPDKDNPNYNGERKFFYNNHKEGKQFDWYANNLDQETDLKPEDITPSWTFNSMWDPESKESLKIIDYKLVMDRLVLTFDKIVTVRGNPQFININGKRFNIVKQRFNDLNRLTFFSESGINKDDLKGQMVLKDGNIISSIASVYECAIGEKFRIMEEKRID